MRHLIQHHCGLFLRIRPRKRFILHEVPEEFFLPSSFASRKS